MNSLRSATRLLLPALLAGSSAAQFHTFQGDQSGDRFGAAVARAGDVDGDGYEDVVVGEPRYLGGFCFEPFQSRVRVYSGRTGALLLLVTENVDQHLGEVVAGVGDVDGDGVPDVAAGTGGDFCCYTGFNGARVFSGATGAELVAVRKPWWDVFDAALVGPGDLDGDGRADLLLGSPDEDEVAAHRGTDGSLLWSDDSLSGQGRHLCVPGDVDGDLVNDVAVATDDRVVLRSGADGSLLGQFPITGVNALDVIDRDGVPPLEILVSQRGTATVLDAALQVQATFGGWSRTRATGDFTADGLGDLLVTGPAGTGIADGADGSLLLLLREEQVTSMASLGDATGDGIGDVVLGLQGGFGALGVAWVYNGYRAPEPTPYCTAAVNSTGGPATIGFAGTWSLGNGDLRLTAGGLPAGMPGIFYYGPGQLLLPFGNGFRCVGAGALGTFRLGPPLVPAAGGVELALDLDSPPLSGGPGGVSPGSTWNFQYWYRDVLGGGAFFNLTDALAVYFIP